MNIDDYLKQCPKDPLVWVERIALCSTRKDPAPFRTVKLAKGINVIWAREKVGDATYLGHGVGKTTFCRLLRYCLGENTFATRAFKERILTELPEAYVAAEVWVAGKRWAVARPLDRHYKEFVLEGGTLEEVFQPEHQSSWTAYQTAISEAVFGMRAEPVLSGGGQLLTWQHLLAWCARDQEAHLDNFSVWRAPRSESDTPGFSRPTSDPLEAVRYCLGLTNPKEHDLERSRKQKLADIEKLEQAVEGLQLEPGLMRERIAARVREKLRLSPEMPIALPQISSPPLDVLGHLHQAIDEKKLKIQTASNQKSALEQHVFDLRVELDKQKSELARWESVLGNQSGSVDQLAKGLDQKNRIKAVVLDPTDEPCAYGNIRLSECVHIQEWRDQLRRGTDITQVRRDKDDERWHQEAKAKIAQYHQRIDALSEGIRQIESQLSDLDSEMTKQNLVINTLLIEKSAFENDYRDLEYYEGVFSGRQADAPLTNARDDLAKAQKELEHIEGQLKIEKSRTNGGNLELNDLLTLLSQQVIPDVQSRCQLTDPARPFQVLGRGGEAFHVMEVLLGDITAALFARKHKGHHPGFMVHDSPREADMGAELYSRYMALLLSLGQWMDEVGRHPIQYIVATTTAPAQEFDDNGFIRLVLHAAQNDGLLFERTFSNNSLV